ncbi:MAG: ethanolamine permease [Cytophagales bacterium]|jgi:ethanolamine permease|nr:ethanolamine permease [Cytophagales bacterium]MCA6389587.1 ethanolamine permease [Cytophagales bacterium]MCA6393196.1 ethanolamine permease [Cytophagales bacterium]MCA6395874.1 ethanolamine permease [Cytophagales bacterium]MCA6398714.1 ethanolamine permease [Cytophagales bacterium]
MPESHLKRSLTPAMVWGLGVGYVISGNYFGWNLGLEKGGTLGLAIAIFFIIILYITFTFSYTELACAIPKSGGAFDYANRAFGKDVGFITGMAQNIEFIFAPPAIAFAIGSYGNIFFPDVSVLIFSVLAYFIFVALNIWGVKVAATFELVITILAVFGLLFFAGLTFPKFQLSHLQQNAFPFGYAGVFAAIPFAIWFFLGIEGVANLAEEAIDPKRTILIGFGSAIATLVILCLVTFVSSVGVAGWEAIVFESDGAISDSPLPLALAQVVDANSLNFRFLLVVGLFGLIASFHGLMLAAGRSTYEFGRVGYAPAFVGMVHPEFKTPANALIVNMGLGILALLTGKTGEIITIAVFGALTLYIISMLSLIQLRRKEPHLVRPFRVPLYPVFPLVALGIASFSFVAMAIFNLELAGLYFLIIGVSYGIFKVWNSRNSKKQ